MGCCENKMINNFDNPSEEFICDLISKMKIHGLTFQNFVDLLEISKDLEFNFNEFYFKKVLTDEIVELDFKKNPLVKVHLKIFDLLSDEIQQNFCKDEIILTLFPLLKLRSGNVEDFIKYLKNISKNQLSKEKLKLIFKRIFEIYSFKINNIIYCHLENEDMQLHTFKMNKEFYNESNIQNAVDVLFSLIDDDEKNLFLDLESVLKEKEILKFEKMREWIITIKYEKEKGNFEI